MTGATGKTFLDFAAQGTRSINMALNAGNNVTGIITGYDGVFVYVTPNDGEAAGKPVAVPVWNIQLGQLTN